MAHWGDRRAPIFQLHRNNDNYANDQQITRINIIIIISSSSII